MNRESIMFAIEGIDNTHPRFVARKELIDIFAGMAQSDLLVAHGELMAQFTDRIDDDKHFINMPAHDLIELLEHHMRAVNAIKALLSLRDPDELVEAHM